MSDTIRELYEQIIQGPPSSNEVESLYASALDTSAENVVRMCDYRVLRFLDTEKWLDATARLLESPTECDLVKKATLMLFVAFCTTCDPKQEFPVKLREPVLHAIKGLPQHLRSKRDRDPILARAYLQDASSLPESVNLDKRDRIQVAGLLGTPEAIEFLKLEFATSLVEYDRMEIAKALAVAGDRSGVDCLKRNLLSPGLFYDHVECAYHLARLSEPEGIAYLLPLLELNAEDPQFKIHLSFRSDRSFADVSTPEWQEQLMTRFRNKLSLIAEKK